MAKSTEVDHTPDSGGSLTVPINASNQVGTRGPVKSWLLSGMEPEGLYEHAQQPHLHPWWRVVCLTGVDYFSSLGYAPGIAAVAAGLVSPIATFILVIITLFGALPMYRKVAAASPHGDGSVSMLERILPWWGGKLFVLALLGFVSTGFIITITLSAADAATHLVENPIAQPIHGDALWVTLGLITLLGCVFLIGFSEAIGIAVVLVVAYLALNTIVVVDGVLDILRHPSVISRWHNALSIKFDNVFLIIAFAVQVFPKLALGLSGFETGVLVMPLIKGDPNDDPHHPLGRIRNARKLLTTAAGIMSFFLFASAAVTTLLIPLPMFQPGHPANGRALAYLAHHNLGVVFGSLYDVSTITILWFAGASAMAGLLNIVPRYLPRYGMAPEWARATRPLTVLITGIAFVVTFVFHGSVDAQAGAYATGVLAIMTSATIAVTLSLWRQKSRLLVYFAIVSLIFIYTLLTTVITEPGGIKIAAFFIAAIIVISLISRVSRTTELRAREVIFDPTARRFIGEASHDGKIRIIANHPDQRNEREYILKEREERESNQIPAGDPVLFLEVTVGDASEFSGTLHVRGVQVDQYRVLRVQGAAIPNAIASVLLAIREGTGQRPHIYFGWTEGNPLKHLAKYLLFGEGDIAPVTREILRKVEKNPTQRPAIHVG